MKLKRYIKDKIGIICFFIICLLSIIFFMKAYKVPNELTIVIACIYTIMLLVFILEDFFKKKKFYDEFMHNVDMLDKKYLISSMIEKPAFYEGEILVDTLYEINKSTMENINEYRGNIDDFRDYIEMWIHEAKIPISSLVLMCHNNKELDRNYVNQIKRLDNYIDQVLYYVRSNNAEEDYIIKEVALDKIVHQIMLSNRYDIISKNIDMEVDLKGIKVLTDSKWLEFIVGQLVNNAIKYKKDCENITSTIKITAVEHKDDAVLTIYDNGIGIAASDLPNVFKKSFTGINGRDRVKSTGMGLYIAKKLCNKLGHRITIESENGEYTKVNIIFGKNTFYRFEE